MKKTQCLLLVLVLLFLLCACTAQKSPMEQTADYLLHTVTEPVCGSVGGEWTVLGLARSGLPVDQSYYDGYYTRLCAQLRECGGILDERRNTEYSRVILALTAIGRDPSAAAGYDLLLPLADFDKTTEQGLNGAIWALIALDAGDYTLPQTVSGMQATRERYLAYLLDAQSSSGAWSLTAGGADVDMTAMALQALAKYTADDTVQAAVTRGLDWLSGQQRPNGDENSESAAQVLVALCELGIAPDDARFTKNGHTLQEVLLRFACDDGSFRHVLSDRNGDLMATEQCMYALAAVSRIERGESSLYRMQTETP